MGIIFEFFAGLTMQFFYIIYFIMEEVVPRKTLILSIMMIITVILLIHHRFQYWTRKGVKQKYTFIFRDDITKKLIGKKPFIDMLMDIYHRFPGTRYVGFYEFHKPILMIKDPALIKQVCARNNFYFQDHTCLIPSSVDPLWNKTIFALKGERWMTARSNVDPLFCSRRMRHMFAIAQAHAFDFTNSLVPIRTNVLETEFKDLFTKFSTEVTARAVFDLQNKAFSNVNSLFYTHLKNSREVFGSWNLFKIVFVQLFPFMARLIRARIFSKPLSEYFSKITTRLIKHREQFGIEKQDLISLLMSQRTRETHKHLMKILEKYGPSTSVSSEEIDKEMEEAGVDSTDQTIAAQAMTFFFAGFDIVSTVLCFMCYELAYNSSIQQKLITELDNLRKKHDKVPFNELFELPYLSMVLTETLRKWPPCPFTERRCNKTYVIKKQSPIEKSVKLPVGTTVLIPIWSIHRDPKYWWNPELFDPERFTASNRERLVPCTYIPFGFGPRGCVASKFAIMQIKIIISEILTIFEIVPTKNPAPPLEFDHRTFHLSTKNGVWLGLKKRFM